MKTREALLPVLAIGLGLALSGTAGATTFSYSSYSVVNDQNVTITGPGGFNETGGSGQIVLHGSSVDLLTWCIDIFDYLTGSGTYTFGNTPSDNGSQPPSPPTAALTNAQIGAIGALVLYGNAHLGDNYDVSSGTQIAIWETEYSALGYSFNGSGSVEAAFLLGLPLAPYYNWDMLSSTDGAGLINNQGLSTLSAPIPEPGSLALLGSALGGAWLIRRRRRS
jgi:hypothetical protein